MNALVWDFPQLHGERPLAQIHLRAVRPDVIIPAKQVTEVVMDTVTAEGTHTA